MRFLNHVYAWLFEYFWKPCPICGRLFGGHEIGKVFLITTWNTRKCVCRNCDGLAWEMNQILIRRMRKGNYKLRR